MFMLTARQVHSFKDPGRFQDPASGRASMTAACWTTQINSIPTVGFSELWLLKHAFYIPYQWPAWPIVRGPSRRHYSQDSGTRIAADSHWCRLRPSCCLNLNISLLIKEDKHAASEAILTLTTFPRDEADSSLRSFIQFRCRGVFLETVAIPLSPHIAAEGGRSESPGSF